MAMQNILRNIRAEPKSDKMNSGIWSVMIKPTYIQRTSMNKKKWRAELIGEECAF